LDHQPPLGLAAVAFVLTKSTIEGDLARSPAKKNHNDTRSKSAKQGEIATGTTAQARL